MKKYNGTKRLKVMEGQENDECFDWKMLEIDWPL